ncbi:MAG: hypothetical protein KJN66_02605 [Bacteroidia bacterium]|nr:hypothetical protein [Bacteroidia bacterium]
MKNAFTAFSVKLILLLGITFCIHLTILHLSDLPLFNDMIVMAYIVNAALAIVIFGFLYLLRDKFGSQLGFLFLGGSFLKFIVFFLVFYPGYKMDNDVSSLEFSAFFIPYILCLILETFSLVKWLNKI